MLGVFCSYSRIHWRKRTLAPIPECPWTEEAQVDRSYPKNNLLNEVNHCKYFDPKIVIGTMTILPAGQKWFNDIFGLITYFYYWKQLSSTNNRP